MNYLLHQKVATKVIFLGILLSPVFFLLRIPNETPIEESKLGPSSTPSTPVYESTHENEEYLKLVFEQRRQRVEEYCKKNHQQMQGLLRDFQNGIDKRIYKANNYIYYNQPSDIAYCVPPKAGSSQTTKAMFEATFDPSTMPESCMRTNFANSHYNNCVQWTVAGNFGQERVEKITPNKFMFYRHPISRLISSWKHGQAVCFTLLSIFKKGNISFQSLS